MTNEINFCKEIIAQNGCVDMNCMNGCPFINGDTACNLYWEKGEMCEEIVINASKYIKDKLGTQPLINKREKLEARLSQVKETTKKAFLCTHDDREIGRYENSEYSTDGTCSPEEALVFAKWVLDLEGK